MKEMHEKAFAHEKHELQVQDQYTAIKRARQLGKQELLGANSARTAPKQRKPLHPNPPR